MKGAGNLERRNTRPVALGWRSWPTLVNRQQKPKTTFSSSSEFRPTGTGACLHLNVSILSELQPPGLLVAYAQIGAKYMRPQSTC
jgi:hypothetical protein